MNINNIQKLFTLVREKVLFCFYVLKLIKISGHVTNDEKEWSSRTFPYTQQQSRGYLAVRVW